MKQNETLWSSRPDGNGHSNGHAHKAGLVHNHDHQFHDAIGDDHVSAAFDTPMREDAFDRTDDEKIGEITEHFRAIMEILGLDLTDDSLAGTPQRVAKMYVQEVFSGLNPANKPDVRMFENKYQYNQMLVERDITFFSNCEHHFVPIYGKVHVAYFSTGKVVGLSKLNRIVQYYARRPQVQERMTIQIAREMQEALNTDHVAVLIEADHMCVQSRGIQDSNSSTVTAEYCGKFLEPAVKDEFLRLVGK